MAVRRVEPDEDLNEAIRAARGDTVVVDSYHEPEGHRAVNQMLFAARMRGTIERDAVSGKLLAVEGRPVEDPGE